MSKRKRKIYTQLEVIDAGAKGKAVAKTPDGKAIFMSNAVPGDIVDVQVSKKRKAYLEGNVIATHQYSDKRIEPRCKHFTVCGGCKWQQMDYKHQLYYKQKEVFENLNRIAKVDLPELFPIKGSDQIYHYRNKMEFSFSDQRWLTLEEIQDDTKEILQREGLGFHIPGKWDKILDLEECFLQADPSNEIRLQVKQIAIDQELSFYSPRNKEGFLRTLMLRTSSTTGQIMVLVQFFEDDAVKREKFLEAIAHKFPQITSLQYVVNTKGNDTIYDQEVVCYKGVPYIEETMEGLIFRINAKSFYQTNSLQAYELYKITREFAQLSSEDLVYDLYTGMGTIAQFVAKSVKKVVGIESVPEAIAEAKQASKRNGIDNTVFYAGDMKNVFTADFIRQNGTPDVVITDPPRDGMHPKVVEQLLSLKPKRIVYVSCNSATQARDLQLLDKLYEVTKVQAVDMFPQTHHIENIVSLVLR